MPDHYISDYVQAWGGIRDSASVKFVTEHALPQHKMRVIEVFSRNGYDVLDYNREFFGRGGSSTTYAVDDSLMNRTEYFPVARNPLPDHPSEYLIRYTIPANIRFSGYTDLTFSATEVASGRIVATFIYSRAVNNERQLNLVLQKVIDHWQGQGDVPAEK